MLEKEVSRTKANEIENERGRSMVEMLGTLAIMGVLAIGGIAGYRYAMDKYNANEILNEVRKRAVTASQQRLLGHSINLSEYGVNTVQGYAIETADNYNGNATQFTITVKGIEQGVCNQVIDSPLPMVIEELVGGVVVADDVDCTAETNDVLFAFANDLASGSVGEGDDGNGGEGNPPEEFDPTAPENNVICLASGECYTCDDLDSYSYVSDESECLFCPDRKYDPNRGICQLQNCDGFHDYWGRCYPCDTPEGIYVGGSGPCEEKCPNRVENGSYCNLESVCENGFQDSYGVCYPCDTPEGISNVSRDECEKCKDAEENLIRERNSSGYCNLKSVCDNGFQSSSGKCYSCDTPEGVYVGSGGVCEEKCPNRVKNGYNYCILADCDGLQDSYGSCYPCDTSEAVIIKDGACSEICTDVRRFKRCKGGTCFCNLCPKNVASLALNTWDSCTSCGGIWENGKCRAPNEGELPEVSGGYQPEQTVSGYY